MMISKQSQAVFILQAADLQANSWAIQKQPGIIAMAEKKGHECFDDQLYIAADPVELAFLSDAEDRKMAAWQHFIVTGIREGRPYKFTC